MLQSTLDRTAVLAPNYRPLEVTLVSGDNCWVTDVDGKKYLDCLAGYSALNFGHNNPELNQAVVDQLHKLTLVSRAFDHDQMLPFAKELTELTGTEMMLPMNTGAEAVESAIKAARKWGYEVKGVAPEQANIVVAENSFHGRTTTIVSFSTDADAKNGYGPYTPGFRVVPYGDIEAVKEAIDENTVAALFEPIQGESGVVMPPENFLPDLRELCTENDVLMILDEIQSGLGRTGDTLAQDLYGIRADLTTLGKALGGGVLPVSAVVGRRDVLSVLTPGTHGSTFGGNPLACAVGRAVIKILKEGEVQERAKRLGEILGERLDKIQEDGHLAEVRHRGLWAGIDVEPRLGLTGRQLCERLAERGMLCKDTHGSTIRLAPPLTISEEDLNYAMDILESVLNEQAAEIGIV
ncbi:ornithine--oxo-acid transaminase [Bowdeniella nasicola]|uniref:ornithine aminotransferase n=1 Tax=Bowdeniella nasicola TaxID=208480 RepID=A0A1Q5Q4J7_9ACTO|nr:ornithine--oxo-acid transaminase [Bowdeniella nasicola]OKL54754.1 ornithine--oxo-acid transaminase [Bowdeniella nasicola]